MLRPRMFTAALVTGTGALIAVYLGAGSAWAGDVVSPYANTSCGVSSCGLVAGTGSAPARAGGGAGGAAAAPGVGSGGSASSGPACSWIPTGVKGKGPDGKTPGELFQWSCVSSNGQITAAWRPTTPAANGKAGQVNPAVLAAQALSRLRLAAPVAKTSPDARFEQLVHVPVWLWIDPSAWRPVRATASVPGVSVTAIATPQHASWQMGDGNTVSCTGPGTPYRAGNDPAASSPTCGHTYRASSASHPGATFPVTVTESWSVSWSGAGASGTFPNLVSVAHLQLRVGESQALVTGVGAQ